MGQIMITHQFLGHQIFETNSLEKPKLPDALAPFQVYAHKLLCMRCSYFRAMFDGQMREAGGIVKRKSDSRVFFGFEMGNIYPRLMLFDEENNDQLLGLTGTPSYVIYFLLKAT
jgi:hypothetical protein